MALPSPHPRRTLPKELTQAEHLPSLPAVAMEVLRLARNERAEFEDYARVIVKDPALAAKLLKLANSPMFGLSRSVTDLKEATSLLGLRTVQLMALGFSLVGGLPKEGGAKSFRHDEYWRRSLLFAVGSREIGLLVDRSLADEAFLCGLLSHLGQLAMAHATPLQYERVLRRCEGWPDAEAERRSLGFDHHDVADALLVHWSIPDAIRWPTVGWDEPEHFGAAASAHGRTLLSILAAASHVVRLACDASGGEALTALHESAKRLGIPRQQMDTLVLVLEHRAQDAMDLLEMKLPKGEDHYALLAEAREQMVQLSLGAAADLQVTERRASRLESQVRRLSKQLTRDPLTGLCNREHLEEVVAGEVQARLRHPAEDALGLIGIEIDGFDELNEAKGQGVGDEVLRVIGQAIGGTSRATDVPARTGGGEFAVLAPSTDVEGLQGFGERLCKFCKDLEIHVQGRIQRVTLSVGGATLGRPRSLDDAARLLEAAAAQLAIARRGGGDRVAIARTPIDD